MKMSARSKIIISLMKRSDILLSNISDENLEEKRREFKKLEKYFKAPRSVGINHLRQKAFEGEWIVPKQSRNNHVVMYIAGGGFVFDGSKLHRDLISRIAHGTKAKAFSLQYSLAPEHPYPKALNEAMSAYNWLLESYEPSHIAVVGDSAGGTLVLSLLHKLRDSKRPMPACAVVIAPATDATISESSMRKSARKDFFISPGSLKYFIDSYFQSTKRSDPIASPLLGSMKKWPPLLIHVDKDEIMARDSARLYEKAKKEIVEVEFYQSQGLFHVWHMFGKYMPEAKKSIADISKYIQKHFS